MCRAGQLSLRTGERMLRGESADATLIPLCRGDIAGALSSILTDPPYGDGVDEAKVSGASYRQNTVKLRLEHLLWLRLRTQVAYPASAPSPP
jgi:hypothetical protein